VTRDPPSELLLGALTPCLGAPSPSLELAPTFLAPARQAAKKPLLLAIEDSTHGRAALFGAEAGALEDVGPRGLVTPRPIALWPR
jgi:hypothetical protein